VATHFWITFIDRVRSHEATQAPSTGGTPAPRPIDSRPTTARSAFRDKTEALPTEIHGPKSRQPIVKTRPPRTTRNRSPLCRGSPRHSISSRGRGSVVAQRQCYGRAVLVLFMRADFGGPAHRVIRLQARATDAHDRGARDAVKGSAVLLACGALTGAVESSSLWALASGRLCGLVGLPGCDAPLYSLWSARSCRRRWCGHGGDSVRRLGAARLVAGCSDARIDYGNLIGP